MVAPTNPPWNGSAATAADSLYGASTAKTPMPIDAAAWATFGGKSKFSTIPDPVLLALAQRLRTPKGQAETSSVHAPSTPYSASTARLRSGVYPRQLKEIRVRMEPRAFPSRTAHGLAPTLTGSKSATVRARHPTASMGPDRHRNAHPRVVGWPCDARLATVPPIIPCIHPTPPQT